MSNSDRATGSVSSGSSDLRSRSPAVVSIARCSPPVSVANSKKYVSTPSISAERPQETRVDAVRDETQRADRLTVAVDGSAQAADATCRARLRAVEDERDACGTLRPEVLVERVVDDEHDVVLTRRDELRGGVDVLDVVLLERLDAARAQVSDEIRRVVRSQDRHLEHLVDRREIARDHDVDEHGEQDRAEQRPEQQRRQRSPLAQRLENFFAAHGEDDAHAGLRSAPRTASTKISSRLRPGKRCASSAGLPVSVTLPAAMMTSSSTSASTSCITWLDSSTQRPWPRSSRSQSRRCRVAITSRPFVGSSSKRCCGSWTSARASAIFVRSPCEKPLALRFAMEPSSSRSIRASTRTPSASSLKPCSRP